jgi:two-component system response regulator FixJ
MKENSSSTVFLVEDDAAIAQAIQWLLKTVGLNCEWFQNAEEYLKVYNPVRQGCLVIDVRMPGMSGLELQEQLNQRNNPIPIIIITGHGDIPMAVRAMRAGAFVFITKPFNDQVLLEEIQKAVNLDKKKQNDLNLSIYQKIFERLSDRERKIMELIVSGEMNKQIAHKLNIAVSTVELCRSNLMRKMKVTRLATLIKIYLMLETHSLLN